MLRVAIVSWPVSETISPAPTPAGLMTRLAFLAACDALVGLKTTLMSQLCPGAIVAPAQPGPSAGGGEVEIATLLAAPPAHAEVVACSGGGERAERARVMSWRA